MFRFGGIAAYRLQTNRGLALDRPSQGYASADDAPHLPKNEDALVVSAGMTEPLGIEEVRHVAKLARLRLDDEQLARYRSQLASVLEHIAKLNELNVEGVEPMAHPSDVTNRLAEDEVAPPMPVEVLLANAPATQDHFLAVPKVLDDAGE